MNCRVNTTDQIHLFAGYERERYEAFEVFVEWFLDQVRLRVAPMGAVSARTKEAASFAEKILRKPEYTDPVHEFPDLCGGRLVVHTRCEMIAADKLIGQCLTIDKREDKLEVAGVNQFGYGSVHLDVVLGENLEANLARANISMPEAVKKSVALIRSPRRDGTPIKRKAEIQVRTDLQHVWADTLHDLLYKGGVDIPQPLQREANRLSAVLEEASTAIDDLVVRLSAYKVDHGAFLNEDQIKDERNRLAILLQQDLGDKALGGIALRSAKLARTLRNWPAVVALEPWISRCGDRIRDELLLVVAEALCKSNEGDPSGAAFTKGVAALRTLARPLSVPSEVRDAYQRLLSLSKAVAEELAACPNNSLRARAMAELARAVFVGRRGNYFAEEACDLFFQAHLLESENPYVYTRYLHSHAVATRDKGFAVLSRAHIVRMLAVCAEHARVSIELPFAHFNQAMLHALLGDLDTCMLCCARGIAASSDRHQIQEEIGLFTDLREAVERSDPVYADQLGVVLQTLLLGYLSRGGNLNDAGLTWSTLLKRIDAKPPKSPVVIVAGTCDPSMNPSLEKYRAAIVHAFRKFGGTVYCGGTKAGISALVGDAVVKAKAHGAEPRLIAYRPDVLKEEFSEKHSAYEQIRMENTTGFTCAQATQYWTDILLKGVTADKVRVLGIGGGTISLFEYHLAIALGATVGIVEGSGRKGADVVNNESWWVKSKTAQRCFTLPNDPETLWNFLNITPGNLGLDKDKTTEMEPVARLLHTRYVAGALNSKENRNPNLRSWEALHDDLRRSNLHQALYLSTILSEYRICIKDRAATSEEPIGDLEKEIGAEGIERLAEIEHARWNVERLFQGWKYGEVKNFDARISPCLVPWKDLDPEFKEYDREPFRALPGILKEVNRGLYKMR